MRTRRLMLRHWREDDRKPFAAMNADPEVMEHFVAPMSPVVSDASFERIQRHLVDNGWGLWAAQVVEGPEFIGFIGLWQPTFEAHFTPAVEVGWRLVRSAWGHGYAPEGAAAALDMAFDHLALDEVVSMTTAANAKSRRVMEKLGMAHDPADDFDHPNVPDGPHQRHVLYRLPARRWREIST